MKTRVDREWFKNGKIKSECNFKIGFSIPCTPFFKLTFNVWEDGTETHWYESAQKKEEINYKNGKENGLNTGWYENGRKEWEGNWNNGEEDGTETHWYESGQKKEETIFKSGKKISSKEWNEDGSSR